MVLIPFPILSLLISSPFPSPKVRVHQVFFFSQVDCQLPGRRDARSDRKSDDATLGGVTGQDVKGW